MIDTTFAASHLYRHKTSGKDQTMRHETQTGTVGFSKEAQQINCTDEEARILLRKDLPRTDVLKTRGPTRKVLDFLILNPGAALFFGTIGYWFFGALTIGWVQQGVSATLFLRTGFPPLDMFIRNPMVLTVLSFVLLVIGTGGDKDRPSLFGPLGALVALVSLPIAYLGAMLTGAIVFISLPFALSSNAPYDMSILFMFLLPLGYMAAIKMAQNR
jgi:hypothetical protein